MVHGWSESCMLPTYQVLAKSKPSMIDVTTKNVGKKSKNSECYKSIFLEYKQHRGGCVTCFDYSHYANHTNYFILCRHFHSLRDILAHKLNIFSNQGFFFGKSGIYGFSFGARVGLGALMQLPSQYKFADICDMAGPCFDNRLRTHRMDYKSAAKNVLCIHTSYNRGTRYTNGCHQNWRLGHCGVYQDAAGSSRTKSHVMCPYFYISSFDNNFCAVPQPDECHASNPGKYPEGYKLGYKERNKEYVLI